MLLMDKLFFHRDRTNQSPLPRPPLSKGRDGVRFVIALSRSFHFAGLWVGTLLAMIAIFLAACAPATPAPTATPVAADPNATPTNIWIAIQEKTPYAYATPLPPAIASVIDGTYVKSEEVGSYVHCLRCPDYASDGGIWLLRFDKGIFRIYSRLTGWRSLGSYTLSENRMTLFNDGYCPNEVGTYTWSVEQRKLILKEIKDDCSFRLREKNLTLMGWASCQPPTIEAAITDHWQIPEGCPNEMR